MSYQQLSTPSAAGDEIRVNENMAALGQAFVFAHDVPDDTGLVVGFSGGTFNGATLADATVACTDAATNYVVAHRTTGALTTATNTTNWDDAGTYGRVARTVFAAGVLTFHDERFSSGGIFDHGAASGVAGDVAGPASAGNNNVVLFDGTTGKLIKDGGPPPFDVTTFYPGVMTASAVVVRVPVARAVSFAANFAGSYGTASAAATASTAFDVQKNGVSVGTATFAAAATTATFVTAAGAVVSLLAGDVLSIIAPATPDTTLANAGFVLAGTR
ncbi:hypothetical protein [Methylibium sp.]|uniref:hypothetical protein n=1 Tax=Methylibium sp. TaxID=2067992 RepID=UPI001855AE1B|nr:hypothetical protein [Methylibium sp.]MBA3588310.1 hypothetical protein [Methylibium sp.]